MRKIIFILAFIIQFSNSQAQILKENNSFHKIELGFHVSDYYLNYKNPVTFEKVYFFDFGIEPYFLYFPIKNFGIGLSYYYSFIKSNFIELPSFKSVGIFSRYYIPYSINKKFFSRFDFFIEVFIAKTNYKEDYNQPVYHTKYFELTSPFVYNKLSQTVFHAPIIGLNIKIFKNLKAEISAGYLQYINGKNYFDPRLGITYYFFNK